MAGVKQQEELGMVDGEVLDFRVAREGIETLHKVALGCF